MHVKRSLDLADTELVAAWTRFLYENLLGGDKGLAMVDQILAEFAEDQHLGIVFPDDPNIIGWTQNCRAAESLAQRMGYDSLPQSFNFPVGTMFWMRRAALKVFIDLNFDWTDYPARTGSV